MRDNMLQAQFYSKHFHTVENILIDIQNGKSLDFVASVHEDFFKTVDPIDILLITQEHFCNHQRITRNTVATFITLFKKRFKTQLYAFDPTDFKEPGHPVLVFQHENQKFKTILNKLQDKLDQNIIDENVKALFQSLNQMTNHYHRKEKLFFPILERYRHFTVTRIMWKGDDTLRNLYTATKRKFDRLPDIKIEVIRKAFDQLHTLYDDMIFQEETFLIPVVKKLFTRDDWQAIQMESDAFGYAFEPEHPQTMTEDTIAQKNYPKENFKFGGGYLNLEEVNLILNQLPLEITFIDRNNLFKYFNDKIAASEMMLVRTPASIGRNVAKCHPPKSLKKVMRLARDLKTKRRDSESMWFKMNGKYVYITYTGVFNDKDEYMGILETVQDIQPFMDLPREEKRGLSKLDEE